MSGRTQVAYAVVNSGQTVSGDITALAGLPAALWCPVVTSGAVYVQGAFDTTSANFVRLLQANGTSQFIAAVGPGSAMVALGDIVRGVPYIRIEIGVAQTAPRSFAVAFQVY